jgi:pimeloyl-ACP methyl ester carboxylesterase
MLGTAGKVAAKLPTIVATAAGSVIAWSRFGVDHDLDLGQSVDGERFDVGDGVGGTIAAYRSLAGDGAPVLLIHSVNAAASAYEMKPLFEHVRSRRPVFALDLPGYGHSTRGDRNYTPQLMADAISSVLESIEAPAHVVALSLSSEFAARVAIRNPDRFLSLTMISPTGFGSAGGSTPRIGGVLRVPLWSQALFDVIASRHSIEFFLSRSFSGPVDPGMVEHAYRTSHRPGARFAPLAFLSGELFSRDAVDLLYRHVEVPSLILYDRDPFTGFVRLPEFLTDAGGEWSAVRVPDTLGLPHWDDLARTAAGLESHWASHDPKAATNAD